MGKGEVGKGEMGRHHLLIDTLPLSITERCVLTFPVNLARMNSVLCLQCEICACFTILRAMIVKLDSSWNGQDRPLEGYADNLPLSISTDLGATSGSWCITDDPCPISDMWRQIVTTSRLFLSRYKTLPLNLEIGELRNDAPWSINILCHSFNPQNFWDQIMLISYYNQEVV
jgi:hypothetical protein